MFSMTGAPLAAKKLLLAKCSRSIGASYFTSKSLHTNSENVVDFVISGGGMVGAAMACSLGNAPALKGKKIVLLEGAAEKESFTLTEKYSNRVCALSPATVDLLTDLGSWQEICNMRYQPVKRMQVWDSCSDSLITFSQADMTEDLAYIVENDVILASITARLNALGDRVDVRYRTQAKAVSLPTPVEDVASTESPFVRVHLENGETLQTRLLIGADGSNSLVRRSADCHTISWDYYQSAVVATLGISQMENNVAWQRFLPTGPIALLPLSNEFSSLVWSTTTEDAKNLLQLPDESFVDAVNDAYWHDRDKDSIAISLGQTFQGILNAAIPGGTSNRQLPPTVTDVVEGSRAMFPLSMVHSSEYVKPRIALIGDAAHRLHPLAGQGVNLGFGDVVCLTQVLVDAVQRGSDVGGLSHLLQYETQRQRHNLPVLLTIDGLQRLYGTKFSPFVIARSLGLQATNALDFVKNKIIQQAAV
ncbi:ubiquinone biosynthesis monooxygenase COQ6, mitochondrial-like [Liolophura sinensis]|uniref:ubiquinone biosynthesis monooxygenase COQ6, mitochondrial-like n=1 Tax=Liolophura sinensis TaxID=3198878 RepID=UPI003159260C